VRSRAAVIALAASGVALALVAASLVLRGLNGRGVASWFVSSVPPFTLWTLTGAVIAARQPRNAIGWIFAAAGLVFTSGVVAEDLALLAYREGTSVPGAVYAAWYAEWFWVPALALLLVFPLLLFPAGRPPSPRWRPALWLAISTTAVFTVIAALDPKLEPADTRRTLDNPIGVAALGDIEEGRTVGLFVLAYALTILVALASLLVRFRHARGEEREQLKWFTYAGAFLVGGFLAIGVGDGAGVPRGVLDALYLLVFFLPPVAVAIAILRHRLYDIDVVINRTLVYGSVTAVLAGAYLGLVLVFQLAFRPVTEGSGLAVALSTLAVAALFRPARNRVQALVDRRFYRRKYDAQRTLEGFAAHLRDGVDLDSLRAELTGVVGETMQPAHVSLWLREASP
jgi:hypothetical protein